MLAGQGGVADRVSKGHQQPIGIERLLEEVERTPLGGLDGGGDGPMTGDHHDGDPRIGSLQTGQDLEPIETGHLHIKHDDMRPELLKQRQPLAARSRRANVHAFVLEHLTERVPDRRLVVHHEDP